MNVLVIYAHPWEKSLNAQVLKRATETLEKNNSVDIIDLYKDGFNPVLSEKDLALYGSGKSTDPMVKDYQDRIKKADHLVFIAPIWWISMPAILKGFCDKVLLKDFAFDTSGNFPKPLIKHIKGATVFTTMSSPKIFYRIAMKNNIKYSLVKGVLKFIGIKKVQWYPLGLIDNLDKLKAEKWLDKVASRMEKIK